MRLQKSVAVMLAIICLAAGTVFADTGATPAQDLSWWGKSGAEPSPFKDPRESYPGSWWWPTSPKENANDGALWGNRGVVYGQYMPEKKADAVKSKPQPVRRPDHGSKKRVLIHVLFDFGKAVLKPEGKAETDKVVADMKQYGKDMVVVEGHTCNTGSEAYNMSLGQRRADAVKKYIVEQGIDPARITTKSFGGTKPAVPNDTEPNRKLNRRVVFDITFVND